MSLRMERPIASSISADDMGLNMEDEIESISSEEEAGSEYDGEQRARGRSAMEIWNNHHIWTRLQVCIFRNKLLDSCI